MQKKDLLYFLLLIASTLFITSCMSDMPETGEIEMKDVRKIALKVQISTNQSDSRVAYSDKDLSLRWENGDQLAIIGYNSHGGVVGKGILSLSSGINSNEAVFTGNTIPGATQYDVYYPATAIDNTGNVNIDYDNQTQIGNNNSAHLKEKIVLKQVGNKLTTDEILLEERDIELQMQNSIIKFELSNLSVKRPVSLKWEIVGEQSTILSKTLNIQEVDLSDNEKFIGYLSIPSYTRASAKTVNIFLYGPEESNSTLSSPFNFYTKGLSTIEYNPNSRYSAAIDKWNTRIFYRCNLDLNLNSANTFSPRPIHGIYKGDNKESFLDFDSNNIKLQKYDNNVETWKRIVNIDINGINSIGNGAFKSNTQLASVKLHSDLKIIEDNAFYGCSSLNQITIPSNVINIGKDVFLNCNAIGKLIILSETPPTLAEGNNPLGFNGWGTIGVPSSAVNIYTKANGWSNYKKQIKSISEL